MSIKSRIWLFQAIAILAVFAMAAATFLGVRAANDYLSRIQLSRQQHDATMQLAVHANRFSEQIAELLLIGEPERPDFESARSQTNVAISELRRITREEIDFIADPAEKQEEQRELARLDEMRVVFGEIDRAVERVLLLDQQGREAEAIALFRAEIENRFDADFEKLIAAALIDEQKEAVDADLRARQLSDRLLTGTLLLAALLVIAAGSGYFFARSLEVPLRALAEGALAIERGNLDHHIAYDKRDELGMVARRFNAMKEELKRQRQALLDTRNQLERDVAQRTRELGEANRQLSELDRQRVSFLADISHELKTPLTVLRGEAEVTLRGASKPESAYRSALTNIVAQASDMGRLVDDLLFLSRSESDEMRFDFRAVTLPGLVEEAVQEATVLARGRDIRLSLNGARESPIVRADPRRLKQALIILLDNAIKYAEPQTAIDIGVSVMNGGEAQVRVQNHGAVIPPDELPHVFERFYRGTTAAAAGNGGSGLGLAIARWIVEKHDGRIDVASNSEVGTEVLVHLPPMGRA